LETLYMIYHKALMLRLRSWVVKASRDRETTDIAAHRNDLYDAMRKTADPKTGEHFTLRDVWQECFMILIAGSDTTSTALSNTIFHLLHNPSAIAAINQEVRSTFARAEEITPDRVSSDCKFVRACIDEAMRLNPPVAHGPLRQVGPGGISINGEDFEEGTRLTAPIYLIHRHPDYFDHPNDYMPRRWMVEGEMLHRQRKAFVPFGIGPHNW